MSFYPEIAPAYVDVGVKRWQDFTGEAAVLDGDGRTFDQIAAERAPQAAEPHIMLSTPMTSRRRMPIASSWKLSTT